jgi:predicted  nucleic acid-binding Zn-ribbon protein
MADTESRLESDPAVVSRQEVVEAARANQELFAARLRESDTAREAHRSRLRTREKELMSGRIRNPTELMQMSEEVAHMKARFAQEEEAELTLMEDADAADAAVRAAEMGLEEAQRESTAEEPALRDQLEEWRTEVEAVTSERDDVWSQIAPGDQAVFSRVRVRPAVALVVGSQCSACHVTVTSSGMQVLRKGDALVLCENCGRILVRA